MRKTNLANAVIDMDTWTWDTVHGRLCTVKEVIKYFYLAAILKSAYY